MTQRRRGFSLVEVLVATVVVAVGVLAVVSALAYGTRSSAYAERMSAATGYARELMSLVRSQNLPFAGPINDAASARLALDAAPFQGVMPAGTIFRRNITMARAKPAKTGAADDYRHDLMLVTVTVSWWERDQEKQVTLHALHRQP